MTWCILCEQKKVENWFGSFCGECRQIKNLGNVYGFERVLEILKKCCIRDENQLEKKIDNHKRHKSVGDETHHDMPIFDKPTTTGRRATRSSSAAKEV